jgi:hypothetical protein
MKIKIFQYVNGNFVWFWTKYSQSKKPLFGYIPKSHVTSCFDFGIDATIENYLNGKVSLMAMLQYQLR